MHISVTVAWNKTQIKPYYHDMRVLILLPIFQSHPFTRGYMRGATYICPGNLTSHPGDLLLYVLKNAGRIPSRKPYAIRPDNLKPSPVDILTICP